MSTAVILNLAYGLLLASTFTRTLNWLRILLIAGAAGFVAFGALEGIKSMVVWNLLVGGMHLGRLIRDYLRQRSIVLTPQERAVRDEFLPDLTDFDFHLLWAMGEQVSYRDEVMIAAGDRPETVSIVLDGTALIERDGEAARGVRRGGLIGEMSFVSESPATVTVRVTEPLVVHEWKQRDLSSLAQLRPNCLRAVEQMIARDLAAKARV